MDSSYVNKVDNGNNNNEISDDEGSEIDYADIIEKNRLLLVKNLQLDRHYLFDCLRSKGILDEEDVEIVTNTGATSTRQQRVSKFLDIIKRKGERGMLHFVDALQYQNAALYEELTGKKANPSPPLSLISGDLNSTMPRLPCCSYLAKQVTLTTQEMQCLNKVHQKVIDEKNNLERELVSVHNNLHMKEQEIELHKKMHDSIIKMQQTDCKHDSNHLLSQLEQKIIRKDHLITSLQGKLLEQMDEKDSVRKENLELKKANDNYYKEILELNFHYNNEKRQSIVLQERANHQEQDRNYIDKHKADMKQQLRDAKSLREENIALKKEIEEFGKYGDVLNTRYKMVVQEKTELCERERFLSNSQLLAEELINTNSILKLEKEYLEKNNNRLVGDLSISSQLLNSLQSDWKNVCEECERLRKALGEAKQLKEDSEKVIQSHMVINTELIEKYGDACKNLDDLGASLQQANVKIIKLTSSTRILSEALQNNEQGLEGITKNISLSENDVNNTCLDLDTHNYFYRKTRNNKEVLDSIKRNVETGIESLLSQQEMDMSDPTSIEFNHIKSQSLPILYRNHFKNSEDCINNNGRRDLINKPVSIDSSPYNGENLFDTSILKVNSDLDAEENCEANEHNDVPFRSRVKPVKLRPHSHSQNI